MDCARCGIKDAVFLQTLALGAALPLLLYQSRVVIREHHNKKLLTFFLPSTILGTPLGNFLQEHIPSDIVRLVVGIAITFALTNTLRNLIPQTKCWKNISSKSNESEQEKVVKNGEEKNIDDESRSKSNEGGHEKVVTNEENKNIDDESRDRKADEVEEQKLAPAGAGRRTDVIDVDILTSRSLIIWGTAAGFSSGFLGGLVGVRGPPLMVFFLSFPFPKNVIRANSMVVLIANISIRACYYIIEDVSGARELSWFERDLWYLYICVMIFGLLGVPLGNIVAKRINENKFKLVIALMLFISGLSNIIKGSIQIAERGN